MYEFNYYRAASVEDAVARLGEDPDAVAIAGGQSLLVALRQRLASPSAVVDIGGIEALRDIRVGRDSVYIGATSTHAAIAVHGRLSRAVPAASYLAGEIGDPAVRNLGTVGGSLAYNDPVADWPAAALALDATVVTDRRRIASEDFFRGLYETALEPSEIITGTEFAIPAAAAYSRIEQAASGYPAAAVFAARFGDDIRLAVTGAFNDGVVRLKKTEAALKRNGARKATAEDIAGMIENPAERDMIDNIHAGAAYRANLVRVAAKRAIMRLSTEKNGGR